MAQTMVNFRLDENIKRDMESACREMGLSMTAAFTIFATRVGRERRIPFELTAEPGSVSRRGRGSVERGDEMADHRASDVERELVRMREQLTSSCDEIRRALTHIHTAIPASVPGLAVERIRLLCSDELKEKTAVALHGIRSVLSDRNLADMAEKDTLRLEDYGDALFRIEGEVKEIRSSLVPTLRGPAKGAGADLDGFRLRLSTVSKELDGLQELMALYLHSRARRQGTARSLQSRIRRAAEGICDPDVKAAAEGLELLVLRRFDGLPQRTRSHLEAHYLQTLLLMLEELENAERKGEEPTEKAGFCLRVIRVMEQVIEEERKHQDALSSRSLEAEVIALERIAAMRGEVPGELVP